MYFPLLVCHIATPGGDVAKFDLEEEVGIRIDGRTATLLSIGQVPRNYTHYMIADIHLLQDVTPAGNHAIGSETSVILYLVGLDGVGLQRAPISTGEEQRVEETTGIAKILLRPTTLTTHLGVKRIGLIEGVVDAERAGGVGSIVLARIEVAKAVEIGSMHKVIEAP